MALSESFLGICRTTIQLLWANLLKRLGLFEKWKKKGEKIKLAIKKQKEELDNMYTENSLGTSPV